MRFDIYILNFIDNIMDEFKVKVLELYNIEQNFKTIKKEIKKQNQAKDDLTEEIVKFMQKNDIENCKVQNEVLHLKKITHLEAINKDFMKSGLEQFFKDGANIKTNNVEELATTATEFLMNTRENSEKATLRFLKK